MTGLAPTIGRADELRRLRAEFPASPTLPVVRVLTGMGGVGKTSLARAYTQRHRAEYGLVWWVRAEDPSAIDAEFRALLDILLPPGQAAQITNARTAAFAQLAKQDTPWLLVLDNIGDPSIAYDALPPAGPGHILITSQATGWPDPGSVLPLHPLDPQASVDLLTRLSGDNDRQTAATLATELDGLPLALAQAAAFVHACAIDLGTYLRWYRDRGAELHREGRPADYPHTVATTWNLAMDRLTAPARELLSMLAFCAPDAIPVQRLFGSTDGLATHRAVAELHAYSLVTPAAPNQVSVHRLIQAVTRDQLGTRCFEWADKAHELIAAALPQQPVTAATLATWNAVRTHVQAVHEFLPPERALSARLTVAEWTGWSGNAARARDLMRELTPVMDRVLGPEHFRTLTARHALARWTGNAGDPAEGRDLFAELVPIRERVLGPEHPVTISTRQALAARVGQAGDAVKARDMYAELVPIRQRVLGANHPDTLTVRHSLACWTGEAGDPLRARDMLAEVTPVLARVVGDNHPDVLLARHHLAKWTGIAGDPARARDLHAELLPQLEPVVGPHGSETLKVRHGLAIWTGRAGDPLRARDLLAQLLPDQERAMGAEHADTVATRRDLAYWSERT